MMAGPEPCFLVEIQRNPLTKWAYQKLQAEAINRIYGGKQCLNRATVAPCCKCTLELATSGVWGYHDEHGLQRNALKPDILAEINGLCRL
jgi:hypothetical protein